MKHFLRESTPGAGEGAPPATQTAPTAQPAAQPETEGRQNVAATPESAVSKPWTDSITDEETKSWVVAKGFKDVAALSRSAQNLEKLVGVPADRIVKLPTGDDPEAWGEVYNRLGRPKTAAEYEIEVPKGEPDTFANQAKEWFHETGVSQVQADKLVKKWNEFHQTTSSKQKEAYDLSVTAEMSSLKQEWGVEYDAKAAMVEKAAESFGMTDQQLVALKVSMGPGEAMKFLHKIGTAIPEPSNKYIDGETQTSFKSMSSDQAQEQIKNMNKDKAFSSAFAGNQGEQAMSEARAKMKRLQEIAFPGMSKI